METINWKSLSRKRVINKGIRYALALLVFILFIALINYWYHNLVNHPVLIYSKEIQKIDTQKLNSKTIADSYIKNAQILSFESAHLKYNFTSSSILYYSGDAESIAYNPRLTVSTLASKKQTKPKPSTTQLASANKNTPYPQWNAKSDQAWLSADTKQIRMEKNVVIIKNSPHQSSVFKIETDTLLVWPKKEYAKTDKYVKIVNNKTLITAVGMTANLLTKQYHLLNNVRVKIKP